MIVIIKINKVFNVKLCISAIKKKKNFMKKLKIYKKVLK